jgi:hypothetical protein
MAEDAEMAELAKAEGLEIYRPELGTAPRVCYKNLHKWTKVFIAGSVAFGDTGECAEGAQVVVSQGDATVSRALTNNFGDFCIDSLDAGGDYRLSIEAPGYKPVETSARPNVGSLTLEAVFLERS